MDKETTPLISGPAPAAYPVTAETGYPNAYPPSTGYPPYPPAPYPHPNYPPAPYAPHGDGNSQYYAPNAASTQYPQAPFNSAPPPHALPPPYAPSPSVTQGGLMAIPCRVCAQTVEYTAKPGLSAIRCNKCHHATQVGPPPNGKKFILCPCNTLLTVSESAKAATCPKTDCKRTLILAPEAPGKSRAFCSHCNCLLTYNATSAVVICPKCRGRSVVNRTKLNSFITLYFVLAFILIGTGIGLTVMSYTIAEDGGGVYFVFWGLVLAGVLMLVRAGIYVGLNRNAVDARIVPV